MTKLLKENPIIVAYIVVAIIIIIVFIAQSENKEISQWFDAPLSSLTKGDIIIFILCFGLWTRK